MNINSFILNQVNKRVYLFCKQHFIVMIMVLLCFSLIAIVFFFCILSWSGVSHWFCQTFHVFIDIPCYLNVVDVSVLLFPFILVCTHPVSSYFYSRIQSHVHLYTMQNRHSEHVFSISLFLFPSHTHTKRQTTMHFTFPFCVPFTILLFSSVVDFFLRHMNEWMNVLLWVLNWLGKYSYSMYSCLQHQGKHRQRARSYRQLI